MSDIKKFARPEMWAYAENLKYNKYWMTLVRNRHDCTQEQRSWKLMQFVRDEVELLMAETLEESND